MGNKHAARYLRQVRRYLPCSGNVKRSILNQVKNNLLQFLEDDPSANYDSIVRRFGQPHQIASTFVDEMNPSELLTNLQIRRRIVGMISLAVAVGIVIWLATAGLVYIRGVDNVTGTIETSIEVFDDTISQEEQPNE